MRRFALPLLALVALRAGAEDLTAIRAGRFIDVERGEVRRDQVLLVRGERIEAVQPASAPLPAGTKIVDLSGYTRAAGPHRLPHPPGRRHPGGERGSPPGTLGRAGGLHRRASRAGDAPRRLHERSRRGHLPRLRRRGPARRHQRGHRARAAHGGGGHLRHAQRRRRRCHRACRRDLSCRATSAPVWRTPRPRCGSACASCSTVAPTSSRSWPRGRC